jgi:hypothetical protein
VTLQCTISHRECLIANQTYRTRKVAVGTVKKSMATITSRRFRRNVSQLCLWFSSMRPRRDRNPEASAAMIARRSRIMEAREAAGLDRKRQRLSMERDTGDPQPLPGRVQVDLR